MFGKLLALLKSFNPSATTNERNLFAIIALKENESLNFIDIDNLSAEEREKVAEAVTRILNFFFTEKLGFQHGPKRRLDPAIHKELRKWAEENLTSQGLISEHREKRFERILDTSANVAQYFYSLASFETQLLVATTTSVLFYINDELPEDPDHRDDVVNFTYQMWKNESPRSKWGLLLRDILAENVKFFGSQDQALGALMGTTISTYIDSCVMSNRFEDAAPFHIQQKGHCHDVNEVCAVERFPLYFRTVNGVPIPYAIPIFKVSRDSEVPLPYWESAIPDLGDFINLGNDVLSFPKEVLAGDTWIYMTLATKARRQAQRRSQFQGTKDGLWVFRDSLLEALEHVLYSAIAVDRAFTSCANGSSISLEEKRQMESASIHWQAFKRGYVTFHFDLARYGLAKQA